MQLLFYSNLFLGAVGTSPPGNRKTVVLIQSDFSDPAIFRSFIHPLKPLIGRPDPI